MFNLTKDEQNEDVVRTIAENDLIFINCMEFFEQLSIFPQLAVVSLEGTQFICCALHMTEMMCAHTAN